MGCGRRRATSAIGSQSPLRAQPFEQLQQSVRIVPRAVCVARRGHTDSRTHLGQPQPLTAVGTHRATDHDIDHVGRGCVHPSLFSDETSQILRQVVADHGVEDVGLGVDGQPEQAMDLVDGAPVALEFGHLGGFPDELAVEPHPSKLDSLQETRALLR
jgi:hypothetical protein